MGVVTSYSPVATRPVRLPPRVSQAGSGFGEWERSILAMESLVFCSHVITIKLAPLGSLGEGRRLQYAWLMERVGGWTSGGLSWAWSGQL
jgi:hypothetical protein